MSQSRVSSSESKSIESLVLDAEMSVYRGLGSVSSNELRAGLDGISDPQLPDVRLGGNDLLSPFSHTPLTASRTMTLATSSASFTSGHGDEGGEWSSGTLLRISDVVREAISNNHATISDEALRTLNIFLEVVNGNSQVSFPTHL